MRILTEASGSLVGGFLIKAIQAAGHEAIASDIDPCCAGRYLANDFVQMPKSSCPDLWKKVGLLLEDFRIDLVIPSFDETLLGWAQALHASCGASSSEVLLSSPDVIETFVDKWKAYQFFTSHNIPTPLTSLEQEYPLVKPRFGRGGRGVKVIHESVDMNGFISQQLANGDEFTVDVLCDNNFKPVYIVPRRRLGICDGKSTQGFVVQHSGIDSVVRALCSATSFRGPVNIQCFCDGDGNINIIEVNPRISGGMALGFAATENWVPLMVAMVAGERQFDPLPIKYGLRMMRYYSEIFV